MNLEETNPKLEEADTIVQEHKGGGLEEKPKKRRGRPLGSKNKPKEEEARQPVEIPPQVKAIVGKGIGALFTIAAVQLKDDKWKLTAEEETMLGETATAVLAKHAPDLAEYAEETALAICLLTVFAKRMLPDGNANLGEVGVRQDYPSGAVNAATN